MANDVQIVHFIPGRVRFKAERIKRSPAFTSEVQQRLGALAGVQQVEINPLTGSVLVVYDPQVLGSSAHVKAAGEALHALFPSLDIEELKRHL